jgi:hypothetical protein
MLASLLSKALILFFFLPLSSGCNLVSESILLEKALMDFPSLAAKGFRSSMSLGRGGWI